jgi:hypothetical protein
VSGNRTQSFPSRDRPEQDAVGNWDLNAQAEPLALCVHAAVATFFLDGKRCQIRDNQQGDRRQPGDDDHCKGVLHNPTGGRIAWGGPTESLGMGKYRRSD